MVVFVITELNYLVVSLFYDLFYSHFRIFIVGITFLRLRYLSCFLHSEKTSYALPKVIYHIVVSADQAKLFSVKIYSLKSVLQIVRFMVLF